MSDNIKTAVGPAVVLARPARVEQTATEYYEKVLEDLRDPSIRPEAVNGRYRLPDPTTGKSKTWQRVTNFVKSSDDPYYLELWKQRNVAKGLATILSDPGAYGYRTDVPETLDFVAGLDVKDDKPVLDNLCKVALDVAEAYKMANAGTLLHTATEVADYMGGDTSLVLPEHRERVRLYLDALFACGISTVRDMIERVTLSSRYGCAGKFDRIFRLRDGSYVIGDLKTGDSLDWSFPSIAAQLNCYEDGINAHGVYDDRRYDDQIKVRTDIGIVVHLPSTREEVTVYEVDLSLGRVINASNLAVRDARKIKAKHVSRLYAPAQVLDQEAQDQYWLDQMNGAYSYDELLAVSKRARCFGHWNERLVGQARVISAGLSAGI